MDDENRTLVIWFNNGGTAYFEQVTDIEGQFGYLRFRYWGKSTETFRKASFDRNNIAGYAISL